MEKGVAAKLLTCWLLEKLGREQPELSFLQRLSVATTACNSILELQPEELTEDFETRLCRLVRGEPVDGPPAGATERKSPMTDPGAN